MLLADAARSAARLKLGVDMTSAVKSTMTPGAAAVVFLHGGLDFKVEYQGLKKERKERKECK